MPTEDIKWSIKGFYELSNDELYDILALRAQIFILEQFCPYVDPDNTDKQALHLFSKDHTGQILAYSRILEPGIHYPEASIGRIITSPDARGKGYGKMLMIKSIEAVREKYGAINIKIGAQSYLEKFYAKHGFKKEGDVYLEDNIPHYKMVREATTTV